jgi:cleavage and polyadenylation specificity factor subunit 1
LAIVEVTSDLLLATTLLDLSPSLTENSYGAVTPWEQDLTANLLQKKGQRQATVSVVLGGGVSIVCVQLKYYPKLGGWRAVEEPYVLPLSSLAQSIENGGIASNSGSGGGGGGTGLTQGRDAINPMLQSIVTGFGDILSTAFLPGYSESTMVILHANPYVGHTWSGRLGREEGGTRYSLVLTAVTVTVGHQRSALLWSTEVPADAMYVYSMVEDTEPANKGISGAALGGATACLVHCVNCVVFVTNTGQIQQCLATNGWVGSTLSASYSYLVSTNPWPFPKLSIQLDGAHFAPVNATTWFVVLRRGQIFLLQCTGAGDGASSGRGEWAFMSLFQTVGAVGEVSHLSCHPLGKVSATFSKETFFMDKDSMMLNKAGTQVVDIGFLFVASRLGDSSLLGYSLEEMSVANAVRTEPGMNSTKKENTIVTVKGETMTELNNVLPEVVDEEYDRILRMEEEALYADVSEADSTPLKQEGKGGGPDIVPPSDDEQDTMNQQMFGIHTRRKRARMTRIVVVRSLNVLDSLTSLGPLGPACSGPLASSPEVKVDPTASMANAAPVLGTTGFIFPCGFGNSGGLALLSIPGRDDRTILAEADCVHGKALFSLPQMGLALLAMLPENGGTVVMKLNDGASSTSKKKEDAELDLEEVDLAVWCPKESARDFLTNCHLLAATDLAEDSFLILVASPFSDSANAYFLVVFQNESSGTIRIKAANQLDIPEGDSISRAFTKHDRVHKQVMMAYSLSNGESRLAIIDSNGAIETKKSFEVDVPMDTTVEKQEEKTEEDLYYADRRIVAMDIFKAPESFFTSNTRNKKASETKDSDSEIEIDYLLDEDDKELYFGASLHVNQTAEEIENQGELPQPNVEDVWYFAACRQSGELEIYLFSDLEDPVWTCKGCGHGVPKLDSKNQTGSSYRAPQTGKVCSREIKFFFCGPSSRDWSKSFAGPRPFCLILETSDGDAILYTASIHHRSLKLKHFDRIPLKDVTRPSQESTNHFSKLRRKKIVAAKDIAESPHDFRHNNLFSFAGISGQNGVFASLSRPFWVVAERGKPVMMYHRCRHAAPAGARRKPIAGFCSGLSLPYGKNDGFMTLHERVGRVGSQRITLFDGIVNLSAPHSLLPGGGVFVEKIPFGVTVRRIQFIDDSHVSTGTHPLYAVLVSREFEADQSDLNDDGMTDEERKRQTEERENEKIQRQVEADLGGFDVEQEWVEEIEREDCFTVDKELGGAPPIARSAYSLWIVDAADGWQVVDSYEFGEDEICMTMEVMLLSEFLAEPGSEVEVSEDDLDTKLFITVGTGIVDKNGEDVSSKGRVILFEIKRTTDRSSLQIADLNFVYEKKIFHGPVSTLTSLVSEGKYRLIIGAGADVNIEQWGNDRLTQVGFFRATMAIVEIKLFKSFLILSDAYDSLYFLVWRESDKSITLLAKDYDPIPVYCAGILSRGGSIDFVCHDDRQNLQFFQYAPGDPAARGGNKLVCRADFHLGSQTTDMRSHFCRSSLLINSATPTSTLAALKQQDTFFGKADDDQRLAVSFGTTDGSYGSVVPLSEPIYWRLTALQSVLVNALESDCALSHRAWRLYRRTPRRGGCRTNDRKKGVIDGDLVMRYVDLSRADQEDLASAIGSTVDMILDNLSELRCAAMVI